MRSAMKRNGAPVRVVRHAGESIRAKGLLRPGIALCAALLLMIIPGYCQDPNLENKGKQQTVFGYVRDVACLMRHPDALKPTNECAIMCAKEGSPLVLATKKGELYTPISQTIPDKSQRERLMPFVGKYVRAKGLVFEREGMKTISIEEIDVAKKRTEGEESRGLQCIQHSYYWRRGGILKTTKTEASTKPIPMHPALKRALLDGGRKALGQRTRISCFRFDYIAVNEHSILGQF